MSLTSDQAARHAVQLRVPGMTEGQERLAAARVRVVGAGGLAGPALIALAQAGVGRLWIDDPEAVNEADERGWLLAPGTSGAPRADVAVARLQETTRMTRAEQYPIGGVPTATLICAPTPGERLVAAEQARRAGVPHVVLEPDADGGSVVSIPPGAPCYACARSTGPSGREAQAGAAALSLLAALELLLAIAYPGASGGRRIELVRGLPLSRPTARLAGCSCGAGSTP